MAKLVIAILSLCVLGASAIRINPGDKKRKDLGTVLCQRYFGSYYYDDVLDKCCPCSPCKYDGFEPESVISCVLMGAEPCEAPYSKRCIDVTKPPSPVTNATVVATSTVKEITVPIPDPIRKPDTPPDSTFSIVLIAMVIVILICLALFFTCVCCYVRYQDNCASKVIKMLPKWGGCSNNTADVSSGPGSVSSCQPFIIKEDPSPGVGIHPSPHPSLTSDDGQPRMTSPATVAPDSRMSSYDVQEPNSTLNSTHLPSAESLNPRSRNIIANMGHPQDVNTYPPGISTTISSCSNIGVVATPSSHVVVHNLNVHCHTSDPNRVDLNIANHQIRVEGPETQRTFNEPIQRQSSVMSSNSSGPVENDSQPSSRWDYSIARQDQELALRHCLSSPGEEQSFNSGYNVSGPCLQRSSLPSYSTMSSDMSLNMSQRNSSRLPPQGDLFKDV